MEPVCIGSSSSGLLPVSLREITSGIFKGPWTEDKVVVVFFSFLKSHYQHQNQTYNHAKLGNVKAFFHTNKPCETL